MQGFVKTATEEIAAQKLQELRIREAQEGADKLLARARQCLDYHSRHTERVRLRRRCLPLKARRLAFPARRRCSIARGCGSAARTSGRRRRRRGWTSRGGCISGFSSSTRRACRSTR